MLDALQMSCKFSKRDSRTNSLIVKEDFARFWHVEHLDVLDAVWQWWAGGWRHRGVAAICGSVDLVTTLEVRGVEGGVVEGANELLKLLVVVFSVLRHVCSV